MLAMVEGQRRGDGTRNMAVTRTYEGAYGKAGNGNGGNGNWKWKLETEAGNVHAHCDIDLAGSRAIV